MPTCVFCSIDIECDGAADRLFGAELEEKATVFTVSSIHSILQLSPCWKVTAIENKVWTVTKLIK